MLSTLPLVKIWVNKTHAARRIAARIASGFIPSGNLTPMTHEALCYACMAGIVILPHHNIAPSDRDHVNREPALDDNFTAINR